VSRGGVPEAAGKLQMDGLIHYTRGHITVMDRPKLEERVCECYAVVKKEWTVYSLIKQRNTTRVRQWFSVEK
jgi:hypothetical protein